FILPSLVIQEWGVLSARFQQIFGDIFQPDITDSSFGSDSLISSSSLLSLADAQEILFKPINGVKVDDSRMQSRLDTTMAGLDDQIDVQVTDENSRPGYENSDLLKLAQGHEHLKPQTKQAIAAANKQKKLRKTPQPNLLPVSAEDSDDKGNLVTCPRCQRKNKPEYDYCLGCGQEIETQRKKTQRKAGGSSDYGYSSHGPEEASGCLTQLFYFIIGAGALLFFISLGK
ncbi:MAG TPA: zinc ribbon domain-containing protein, partial [Candidatus Ozemobacteraceae bacterium]|nr:zinc ribbon domain-containing protein [Candidatus Ozemobacteraceae bacterium]